MRSIIRGLAVFGSAGLLVVGTAVTAQAHEDVETGGLSMAIGFGTEPAYAGQPNSVQAILSYNGEPVTQLGDSLKVEVGYGDATTDLALEPYFEIGEFGTLGDYRAWFIPSQTGSYTFHFTGSVEGQKVNETVRSGPKTFSDVEDPQEAAFPPINAPTNQELATKIDQVDTRSQETVAAAEAAAADSKDAADSAKTLALFGLIVGAIGVIAGIAGIAAARRRRT
jgi:hypothetical protein